MFQHRATSRPSGHDSRTFATKITVAVALIVALEALMHGVSAGSSASGPRGAVVIDGTSRNDLTGVVATEEASESGSIMGPVFLDGDAPVRDHPREWRVNRRRREYNHAKAPVELPIEAKTWQWNQEVEKPAPFSVYEEARKKGFDCASFRVLNQRSCGTCWAHAAATAYSQRLCYLSNGLGNTIISPAQLAAWRYGAGEVEVESAKYTRGYDSTDVRQMALQAEKHWESGRKVPAATAKGSGPAASSYVGHARFGQFGYNAFSSYRDNKGRPMKPDWCRPYKCEPLSKNAARSVAKFALAAGAGSRARSGLKDAFDARSRWKGLRNGYAPKAFWGSENDQKKLESYLRQSSMAASHNSGDKDCSSAIPYMTGEDYSERNQWSFKTKYNWALFVNGLYRELKTNGPVVIDVPMKVLEQAGELTKDQGSGKIMLSFKSGSMGVARRGKVYSFLLPLIAVSDHQVVLTGWGSSDEDGDYWIAQNSWGQDWNGDGMILLRRGFTEPCSRASSEGVCEMDFFYAWPDNWVITPTISAKTQAAVLNAARLRAKGGDLKQCPNNGELLTTGECRCRHPYGGKDCMECERECQNGGTLDAGSCLCKCNKGYWGDECQWFVEASICPADVSAYLGETYENVAHSSDSVRVLSLRDYALPPEAQDGILTFRVTTWSSNGVMRSAVVISHREETWSDPTFGHELHFLNAIDRKYATVTLYESLGSNEFDQSKGYIERVVRVLPDSECESTVRVTSSGGFDENILVKGSVPLKQFLDKLEAGNWRIRASAALRDVDPSRPATSLMHIAMEPELSDVRAIVLRVCQWSIGAAWDDMIRQWDMNDTSACERMSISDTALTCRELDAEINRFTQKTFGSAASFRLFMLNPLKANLEYLKLHAASRGHQLVTGRDACQRGRVGFNLHVPAFSEDDSGESCLDQTMSMASGVDAPEVWDAIPSLPPPYKDDDEIHLDLVAVPQALATSETERVCHEIEADARSKARATDYAVRRAALDSARASE